MSVEKSTPDENQAFRDALDILEQVRGSVLWTPESDFRKVCSCDDCLPKIERLYEFEKEIKAKRRLILEYCKLMDNKDDLCCGISACIEWTKWTFCFFKKKLEAVSEKSVVPWTKLEDIREEIKQMLINADLVNPSENDDDYTIDVDDDDDVLSSIEYARYHYNKIKAKDKAFAVLLEMENIEKDRRMDMKTVEAQKERLHPHPAALSKKYLEAHIDLSVSKEYLEKQIKELKKLPIEESRNELKEVIAEIRPRNYSKLYVEARQSMYDTCYAMIGKKLKFWRKSPSLTNEGNEHILNGLGETLDSLLDEVNSFEKKWEDNYARYYTPGDQSDPKRQRIE